MNTKLLPNFILAGCGKSGTSAIAKYLSDHPRVYFSRVKEPRYFAFPGERPYFEGPGDEDRFNKSTVWNWNKYKELFYKSESYKAIGEGSPIYTSDKKIPQLINKSLPNIKIIISLRNPVDRAFSMYMHNRRDGYETETFENALKLENNRINNNWAKHWRYKTSGFVSDTLRIYKEIFGPDRILFIRYEDFLSDNQKIMNKVFRFLEIENFTITEAKVNSSGLPRNVFFAKLISNENILNDVAKNILPRSLRKSIRNKYIINDKKQTINKEIYNILLDEFKEEINNLSLITEYDFSHWMLKK